MRSVVDAVPSRMQLQPVGLVVPGYSWWAHLKDVHIIVRKVWLSEIRQKLPREPLLAPSKVLQVFDVLLVVPRLAYFGIDETRIPSTTSCLASRRDEEPMDCAEVDSFSPKPLHVRVEVVLGIPMEKRAKETTRRRCCRRAQAASFKPRTKIPMMMMSMMKSMVLLSL